MSQATGGNPTARPPTARPAPTKPKGTPDPNAAFSFLVVGTPRCAAGDNKASAVSGQVTDANGDPLAGQLVQASSGPGGEPISDFPAMTDDQGNYQVTFVCDGKACDGSFWVWMVDESLAQESPFVQFIFDNRCRVGTLNFQQK